MTFGVGHGKFKWAIPKLGAERTGLIRETEWTEMNGRGVVRACHDPTPLIACSLTPTDSLISDSMIVHVYMYMYVLSKA